GDLLIADMADREDLVDAELFDRIDHPRGVSCFAGTAGALKFSSSAIVALLAVGSVRSRAHRSHHVDDAGRKAEQKEHDESERRRRQQTVDAPANRRSNKDTGNQFRRKPKTECHGRSPGRSVFAPPCGLVSPDSAVVAEFGQPLFETSEPCGKRSLVRRFFATSISVAVRAFRHLWRPARCCRKQKLRPVTLKSRADHTDGPHPSQDCVFVAYLIDSTGFLSFDHVASSSVTTAKIERADFAARAGLLQRHRFGRLRGHPCADLARV